MELITVTFIIFSTEMTKNNKLLSLFNKMYVFSLTRETEKECEQLLQCRQECRKKGKVIPVQGLRVPGGLGS
jgi:hypothetical protein